MAKVVGVRFRNVGKIYYFNPKTYKIKPGRSCNRRDGSWCRIWESCSRTEGSGRERSSASSERKSFVLRQKRMMRESSTTEKEKKMHLRSARRKSVSMDLK